MNYIYLYYMNKYNIIPIGDHCIISMLLKDLKLRNQSYPFDWITDYRKDYSCLSYNMSLVYKLLETNNVIDIIKEFIGDAVTNKTKINPTNNILFQHEEGSEEDIYTKYHRRSERLYEDIHTKQNLFIMLTRFHFIDKLTMDLFIDRLTKYNSNNKFLFISGIEHPYLQDNSYSNRLTYKYIYYDPSKFYDYDYSHFRPQVKDFFKKYLFE